MRAIVLIDAEALREAMARGTWKDKLAESYLPPDADWGSFVSSLAEAALHGSPEFLRTYIYVPRHYDLVPSDPLPVVSNPATRTELNMLTHALRKHSSYRRRLESLDGRPEARDAYLLKVREDIEMARIQVRRSVEARLKEQRDLASRFDRIEVRTAGEVTCLLPRTRLARAIGLDIRIAADLLMMRDMYDAAILVCGHNGHVPAVRYAKDSGKVLTSVTIETEDGIPVPRPTGRLETIADRHIRVPVERVAALTGWPPPISGGASPLPPERH